MDTNTGEWVTTLQRGAFRRVRDGAGRTVAVFDGLLWITQDGDRRDIFLGRGESFTLDRPGVAFIEALKESRLIVLDAQFAPRSNAQVDANERAFA